MSARVMVLLSCARHPITDRPCRAPVDARALELALRLKNVQLDALHVGEAGSPALRAYLGMGLARVRVCSIPADCDPYPFLLATLARESPQLIIAGGIGAQIQSSGYLPYRLAHELRLPLLSSACELALHGSQVEIVQSLPRGRRRRLAVALPACVTVAAQAAAPRQSAFARARRGCIEPLPSQLQPQAIVRTWAVRRARPLGIQMKFSSGADAEERLRAVTTMPSRNGTLLAGLTAGAAAAALLEFLELEGMVAAKTTPGTYREPHSSDQPMC